MGRQQVWDLGEINAREGKDGLQAFIAKDEATVSSILELVCFNVLPDCIYNVCLALLTKNTFVSV
jgi:hypothetical protein